MKKCLHLIVLSLIISTICCAQLNLEWAETFPSPVGNANSYSMAVDSAGNAYITGKFYDSLDFDPGPNTANLYSSGEDDMFIAKYDANGNYIWAKAISGSWGEEKGTSIVLDRQNNIYVSGKYSSGPPGQQTAVDFDPGPAVANLISGSYWDAFFAKYDSNGNFLWVKSLGNLYNFWGEDVEINAMKLDSAGNVIIAGRFNDTLDFDPGPATALFTTISPSTSGSDIFFAKYDSAGNYQWAKQLGGPGYDNLTSMEVDHSGNIYVAGNFGGGPGSITIDLDPGPNAVNDTNFNGSTDFFFAKYDSNGDYVFSKHFSSQAAALVYAITVDEFQNIYIAGGFSLGVDFDPGPAYALLTCSLGNDDMFIAKYSAQGDYVWSKSFGGFDLGTIKNLDLYNNYLYVSGDFNDVTDFDPSLGQAFMTADDIDVFILKLDTSGLFKWVQQIEGAGATFFGGAYSTSSVGMSYFDPVLIKNGFLYGTGAFSGSTDFNLGPNTAISNGPGIFLSKYAVCTPDSVANSQSICPGAEYSINGHIYTQAGIYRDTFQSIQGCDSIIITNLSINTIPVSNSTQVVCEGGSYTIGNHSYSVAGTYYDTLQTATGCDSVIVTNLAVNAVDVSISLTDSSIVAGLSGASYQWLSCPNYTIIAGATSQSYNPSTATDEYAVIISSEGCADTSYCISLNDLHVSGGTQEIGDLIIYPNPNNGHFSIDLKIPLATIRLILIYNSIGQEVWKEFGPKYSSFRANLSKGVYYLRVRLSNDKEIVKRMTVI